MNGAVERDKVQGEEEGARLCVSGEEMERKWLFLYSMYFSTLALMQLGLS